MSERASFSTKIDSKLKYKLHELSTTTHIPQSQLVDEALEDLIKKYEFRKRHCIHNTVIYP